MVIGYTIRFDELHQGVHAAGEQMESVHPEPEKLCR